MKRFISFARANTKVLVATSVVAISLTVVGVATPAIGGPSLKKISKRLKAMQAQIDALNSQGGRAGAQGPQGSQGSQGTAGANGTNGADGADADFEAGAWGVITRNTIGSGVADLRAGPFGSFGVTGVAAAPPFGEGSLGMQVSDNALTGGTPDEKVAFGNEVDFFGDLVTDIDELGFHVFQTGENAAISPGNMPNITFEVDPNLDGVAANYSSLQYLPGPAPVTNQWSGYIDATAVGGFYFTNGASATATGCTQGSPCSFTALQAALDADDGVDATPATIYTFAVGKGRDSAWVGAVDGLRLNNDVFDFEPLGVEVTTP